MGLGTCNERKRTVRSISSKEIVRRIYAAMVRTEYLVYEMFPQIRPTLPQQIHFIHSEDLLQKYPTFTPKEREDAITKEYGAVFITVSDAR